MERVTDGLRLGLAFAPVDTLDGLAFGAVAAGAGLGTAAPIVMSATAFSGSAQFASLAVLRVHGGLFAVLVAVLALNSRYLAFGAAVAPALSRNPLRRLLQAQLLTDTSWALSMRHGRPSPQLLVGVGGVSYLCWTLGTMAGVAFGNALDYRTFGLDAALPAFFLCLLAERLGTRAGTATAAAGAVLVVCLAPFLPAGTPLLVVLAAATLWGRS